MKRQSNKMERKHVQFLGICERKKRLPFLDRGLHAWKQQLFLLHERGGRAYCDEDAQMEACSFQADPVQSEPTASFCYHNLSSHKQSERKIFPNEYQQN